MANASDVYRNFIYQIERLNPSQAIAREKFRNNDRPLQFTEEQSPADRLFMVTWDGSDENLDIEDMSSRWNDHTFTVEVAYNAERETGELTRLILQDRHLLMTRLRDGDYFTGYTGSAAAVTGLNNRHFIGDEIDRDNPTHWILRQRWRCTIEEIE